MSDSACTYPRTVAGPRLPATDPRLHSAKALGAWRTDHQPCRPFPGPCSACPSPIAVTAAAAMRAMDGQTAGIYVHLVARQAWVAGRSGCRGCASLDFATFESAASQADSSTAADLQRFGHAYKCIRGLPARHGWTQRFKLHVTVSIACIPPRRCGHSGPAAVILKFKGG